MQWQKGRCKNAAYVVSGKRPDGLRILLVTLNLRSYIDIIASDAKRHTVFSCQTIEILKMIDRLKK